MEEEENISEPDMNPVIGKPNGGIFLAFNDSMRNLDGEENRMDRQIQNPFIVPANNDIIKIWIFVSDDRTPIQNLTVNQLKLSKEKDDFTAAKSYTAVFNQAYPYVYEAQITKSTSGFAQHDTIYMRYYVNDGNHAIDAEFPKK